MSIIDKTVKTWSTIHGVIDIKYKYTNPFICEKLGKEHGELVTVTFTVKDSEGVPQNIPVVLDVDQIHLIKPVSIADGWNLPAVADILSKQDYAPTYVYDYDTGKTNSYYFDFGVSLQECFDERHQLLTQALSSSENIDLIEYYHDADKKENTVVLCYTPLLETRTHYFKFPTLLLEEPESLAVFAAHILKKIDESNRQE